MSAALRLLGVEQTPERPGPGAMPDQLLRALELTIGRRVQGLLAGDHRSAVLGRGSELAQVRLYEPGVDDVRQIDWNVTARTNEAHVRVQLAERVLVTWLALDNSPSMTFGTADRRKADVALGVALALGHAASARGNRVGLVSFGGAETLTPPRQGRAGLVGLMVALREAEQDVDRALVTFVSDFRGPRDWRRPLLDLAGRHDVLAVEIRDPREQELPDVGELHLVDPESGRQLRVDTRSATLRRRFAAAAADERKSLARAFSSAGVAHVVLSTSGDWLRPLAGFLRQRAR
jgi:uncharacterized protein (DUF58 family)